MAKKSKAEIKKLIQDLHSDPSATPGDKGHRLGDKKGGKAQKGVKHGGTYRPKI